MQSHKVYIIIKLKDTQGNMLVIDK